MTTITEDEFPSPECAQFDSLTVAGDLAEDVDHFLVVMDAIYNCDFLRSAKRPPSASTSASKETTICCQSGASSMDLVVKASSSPSLQHEAASAEVPLAAEWGVNKDLGEDKRKRSSEAIIPSAVLSSMDAIAEASKAAAKDFLSWLKAKGFYSLTAFVANKLELSLGLLWLHSHGKKRSSRINSTANSHEVHKIGRDLVGIASNVFWRKKACVDWWSKVDGGTRAEVFKLAFAKVAKFEVNLQQFWTIMEPGDEQFEFGDEDFEGIEQNDIFQTGQTDGATWADDDECDDLYNDLNVSFIQAPVTAYRSTKQEHVGNGRGQQKVKDGVEQTTGTISGKGRVGEAFAGSVWYIKHEEINKVEQGTISGNITEFSKCCQIGGVSF